MISKIKKRMNNRKSPKDISEFYMKYYNDEIQEKMVLLEAGQGKNVNGNMFALLRELSTNEKWKEYKSVWVVTEETKKAMKERLTFYGFSAKIVVRDTKEYCRYLATAKYLFTDNSFPIYFDKREGQVYMNTWHGTPLKTLGRSDIRNAQSLSNLQKNFLMSDYALFPNTFTRDVFMKDYMLENIYQGNIVLCDYPRNGVFLNDAFAQKLREKLELQDMQLIAYMPTWRGTNRDANVAMQKETLYKIFDKLDRALRDDQILFVNLHFLLGNEMDYSKYKHIRVFPQEYETYDFLAICDLLITDYSSVFFDYASTGRKTILFTYDLEEYMRDRGTYFPVTDLPFPIVNDEQELIREINSNQPISRFDEFLDQYCCYRDEDAAFKVLNLVINGKREIVLQKAPNNRKPVHLIYAGYLYSKQRNRRILQFIKEEKKQSDDNIILCFRGSIRETTAELVMNLPEGVNCFGLVSKHNISARKQKLADAALKNSLISKMSDKILQSFYEKERQRIFYSLVPEKVTYFTGVADYTYKILHTFPCRKEAYILNHFFDGLLSCTREYRTMIRFFKKRYEHVIDIQKEEIEQYWMEDEKPFFYNKCFTLVNLHKSFAKKNHAIEMKAIAIADTCLPFELSRLKIKLGAHDLENTHVGNGIPIGRNRRLMNYSFLVPFDKIKVLDMHNKIDFIYTDDKGWGLERAGLYNGRDGEKGKEKNGGIRMFRKENTTVYLRQSPKNYAHFCVRSCNITDAKIEQFKLFVAYYMARVLPEKKIVILFEKEGSRYEESASVLYEKLMDKGYKNVFFLIHKSYPFMDSIPQKYRSNLLYKGTFKYYLCFFRSKTFMGSELLSHAIDLRIINKYANRKLKAKNLNYVFLQHGVMYMVSLDAEKRDYFAEMKTTGKYRVVTSSEKEREHFISLGKYNSETLYVCGLPKFDKNIWNEGADKIVIMPTWRIWEYKDIHFDFENSKYYKMMKRIFDSIPEEYQDKVIILPHPLFVNMAKNMEFNLKKYMITDVKYDIILRDTKVLITDYSSISYDAFYRGTNVIFYWEEKDECLTHYGENAKIMLNEENTFGDVCYSIEDLKKVIRKNYEQGQEKQYKHNYTQIVEFQDGKNTERLIKMLKKDKLI